jgi:long-chain acyl-CoA synthetase
VNTPANIKVGTVGRPSPGVTVRVADDGELLMTGRHIMNGYWHNPSATAEVLGDGWFHTGDIGEIDEEGYVRITGRKKELIVTAGGKNVAPAVLEDRLRAHPLISQCMVVGDQQPFIACLVTLDAEALGPWASAHGKSGDAASLASDPELLAEIQKGVDEANKAVSKAEAIRKFTILPVDWTEEGGQLTPSLKLKRSVVMKEFASEVDALYAGGGKD